MKVLLLNGSANKNGNTFTALSEIARQLEKSGRAWTLSDKSETMTIQEFRDYMASGKPVVGGGDVHMMFHQLSQEALKITAEINGKYHTPEQLHDLPLAMEP